MRISRAATLGWARFGGVGAHVSRWLIGGLAVVLVALLVAPAAAALRVTRRLVPALGLAAGLAAAGSDGPAVSGGGVVPVGPPPRPAAPRPFDRPRKVAKRGS